MSNANEFEGCTPGDWHLGIKPGPMVYGPKGEQIADVRLAFIEAKENAANARLLAASPRLLRERDALVVALKGMIARSGGYRGEVPFDSALRFAHETLASLEGGK